MDYIYIYIYTEGVTFCPLVVSNRQVSTCFPILLWTFGTMIDIDCHVLKPSGSRFILRSAFKHLVTGHSRPNFQGIIQVVIL